MNNGNRKRICHISTVHHPYDVRIFHRECGSLKDAGFEVHLVISGMESANVDGIDLHSIPKVRFRPLRMTIMPWVAMKTALRTRSQVYHLHDPELIPIGFVIRWLFRRPVIYDVHEAVSKQILGKTWLPSWLRPVFAFGYRVVEKLLTPGLHFVLANENCVTDYPAMATLVRNYPKVAMVPATAIHDSPPQPHPPRLVYVGGISADRGGDTYLALARGLKSRNIAFQMDLIGPCADPYRTHLESLIAQYDLQEAVSLPGRMPHEEAMRVVSTSAIGLCLLHPIPNYTTCLATKILEYMMYGVSVLASEFDTWRPYVQGERTGCMVSPLDDDAILSTCCGMLERPDELHAMARRGREAVRQKYNWSIEFKSLKRLYDGLVGP